ncbi:hypothetical protein V5O48_001547 [Marasmius crinis-equi]|uniref:Uncharacterized protein n=1 Tax=Marasmius crinis-equi TaxID=585013 RepID=A0ABR3FY57_9AGAR
MVQRNLFSDRVNNALDTCRVAERVSCHFPGDGLVVRDDDDDGCYERPKKRRRISSCGRDQWGCIDRVLDKPSLSTISLQSPKPINNVTSKSSDPWRPENPRTDTPPCFPGSYDLYPIDACGSLWLLQNLQTPNYRALYTSLSLSQSRSASCSRPIATCCIADPAHTSEGLLVAIGVHDPLLQDHTHSINLTQVVSVPSLLLSPDELTEHLDNPSVAQQLTLEGTPGVVASLQVDGSSGTLPDIVDSFGEFKMRRVWVEDSDDGSQAMELFQGCFTLNIFYGEDYEARGCTPYVNHRQAFWGIRQKYVK